MQADTTYPLLSVVIASRVGPPFIDDCLASLQKEALQAGAEVIVVTSGEPSPREGIRQHFPWVRSVHGDRRETIPQMRKRGVEAARGEIVAIIEEHCLACHDWLHRAAEGHARGDYAAVGGPVTDYSYQRLRDWVVYFCEYNGYLPPAPSGEVWDLNGANIAYKRKILLEQRELLDSGYWEASLHPVLFSQGKKFLSIPEMSVFHRGPFDYGYYLRQRYWFSRAFAGSRGGPAFRRVVYLVAAPIVPALLVARMARRVYQKRCHMEKFIQSLPLLIPAVTVLVAGEWVGYLAGPGDALSKVE